MDLQETSLAQQRLGDQAFKDGRLQEADVHYLRAKVAREQKLLLQGPAEVSDPERCYQIQALLTSADQYNLVDWRLTSEDPGDTP